MTFPQHFQLSEGIYKQHHYSWKDSHKILKEELHMQVNLMGSKAMFQNWEQSSLDNYIHLDKATYLVL